MPYLELRFDMPNSVQSKTKVRDKVTYPMTKLEQRIFEAKKNGLTDQEIGEKFNVNLRFIEKAVTKFLGVNVSSPILKKKMLTLGPKNFVLETNTVWSFKSRGSWAPFAKIR